MQEFIAALLAILGTVLVLGGAAGTVFSRVAPATADPAVPGNKVIGFLSRVSGTDRLIAWGVLLLLLAAIASGAISFDFGASAESR